MDLEHDEFEIIFDPSKINTDRLISTIKNVGYTAELVSDNPQKRDQGVNEKIPPGGEPLDSPLLKEALRRSAEENKPIVLDFYADWCIPCIRLEKETFTDPKVAELLEKSILVKIDADKHIDLVKQLGVVGLPDIRFLTSDGIQTNRLIGFQTTETFANELEKLLDQSQRR